METGHDRDHPLHGGMMNTVRRRGDRVVRLAPDHAPALHAFLTDLAATGFTGAPRPLALNPDGHEELTYLEGDVALPPFPAWALTDRTVTLVARLLRRYHDAAAEVPFDPGARWPTALSDPEGGPLLCHNDPCLENVVFRDGCAFALIDFDLAAPGRPRPPPLGRGRPGLLPRPDPGPRVGRRHRLPRRGRPHRLRLLADGYGLSHADRALLPATVVRYNEVSRAFVLDRVERGDPVFTRDLERLGGMARWDRRRDWLIEREPLFLRALTE